VARPLPIGVSSGDQLGLADRSYTKSFSPFSGVRTVKMIRVLLSWLEVVLIVAATFIAWITIYARFALHSLLTHANWQTEVQNSRLSTPDAAYFSDFLYRVGLLALFCMAGRLVFRLRLNPVPRHTKS
jgi:hypothetical protein